MIELDTYFVLSPSDYGGHTEYFAERWMWSKIYNSWRYGGYVLYSQLNEIPPDPRLESFFMTFKTKAEASLYFVLKDMLLVTNETHREIQYRRSNMFDEKEIMREYGEQ